MLGDKINISMKIYGVLGMISLATFIGFIYYLLDLIESTYMYYGIKLNSITNFTFTNIGFMILIMSISSLFIFSLPKIPLIACVVMLGDFAVFSALLPLFSVLSHSSSEFGWGEMLSFGNYFMVFQLLLIIVLWVLWIYKLNKIRLTRH